MAKSQSKVGSTPKNWGFLLPRSLQKSKLDELSSNVESSKTIKQKQILIFIMVAEDGFCLMIIILIYLMVLEDGISFDNHQKPSNHSSDQKSDFIKDQKSNFIKVTEGQLIKNQELRLRVATGFQGVHVEIHPSQKTNWLVVST